MSKQPEATGTQSIPNKRDIPMKLGSAIKTVRRKRGWGQRKLAAHLDVSPTYISQLENDRRDPSWGFLNRLADALDCPLPLLILLAQQQDAATSDSPPVSGLLARELFVLAGLAEPPE